MAYGNADESFETARDCDLGDSKDDPKAQNQTRTRIIHQNWINKMNLLFFIIIKDLFKKYYFLKIYLKTTFKSI
ncbi:hypothetical protein TorRG33x02_095780 [Trema orientale]|uniref:Uncharacterized protein n=1 Tax=Trema orientale TaxID=63057 RepID=A0A2P5F9U0_TREOI|nr:hypothetical protein TorRG33x02_095780 [Trema orientale]